MESSYRRQATTVIIPVIDIKRAATPNASGSKMRVTTGATSTPRAWETTLPRKSFKTFPVKLEDDLIVLFGVFIITLVFELRGDFKYWNIFVGAGLKRYHWPVKSVPRLMTGEKVPEG